LAEKFFYMLRKTNYPTFGGDILRVRVAPEDQYRGRIVFRFRATQAARGVRAGLDNWSQEKTFTW
jgi:hypothetical protein